MGKNKEGWTWIIGSAKWHYMRGNMSLCGKWLLLGNPELEKGNNNSKDNCAVCRKKLLSFPHGTKEICETFDVQILCDLSEHPITKKMEPVYYVGAPTELSAGLHGLALSESFFSEKQLEKYCRSKKGKEEMNKVAAESFHDWDAENFCWKEERA